MTLTLVSFDLCPFVQRLSMVLVYGKQPYETRFIDLNAPPDWFERISPLGKVPLLIIEENDHQTVLFESQVIAEWLNDTLHLNLYDEDPIKKAHQQGWCAFASELLGANYNMAITKDEQVYADQLRIQNRLLSFISDFVTLPYFAGEHITMPDFAFASFFTRQSVFEHHGDVGLYKDLPCIEAWQAHVLALPESKKAIISDYEHKLLADPRRQSSILYQRFQKNKSSEPVTS